MEYTYDDDSDNFLTFDWTTFTWLTAEWNLFPSQRALSGVEYRGPWERVWALFSDLRSTDFRSRTSVTFTLVSRYLWYLFTKSSLWRE